METTQITEVNQKEEMKEIVIPPMLKPYKPMSVNKGIEFNNKIEKELRTMNYKSAKIEREFHQRFNKIDSVLEDRLK